MISIARNSNTEISIIFDKDAQSLKEETMEIITGIFPECQEYAVQISGVAIEMFLEDVCSDKYIIKKDKKNKFFKNLPELFLFSNCLEDVKLFGSYIGSFNEGNMSFYILRKRITNFSSDQDFWGFIHANELLTIEVTSDGDMLNLLCNDPTKIRSLCSLLTQGKINGTGDDRKTGDG